MSPDTRTGPLARLARLAHRRRGRMILAWIALLAAVIAIAPRVAGSSDADFGTPGSESKAAADLIAERFPGQTDQAVTVVWQDPAGVTTPRAQRRIAQFLDRAAALPGIDDPEPARYSDDGTVGMARLRMSVPADDAPSGLGRDLLDMAEAAGGDGLRVELGGFVIRNAEDSGSPEMVGIVAAAIILLLAFGSVVAAGLPLLTALVGLGVSAPLVGVVALALDVPEFAPAIAALLGIGVGIDYALLILTRYRAELAAGRTAEQAIVESVATAGRSVLIAGCTVVIGVMGLMLVGIGFLNGIAVAAAMSVLVVMAASVSLLPALIALAGRRVDRLRIPGIARAPRVDRQAPAARWSRVVRRRPWTAAIAATAVLVALASPVLGLRLGFPDEGNDAAGSSTREAYELVARGFGPGANGPLLVAADLAGAGDPAALDRAVAAMRRDPGVAAVSPAIPNRSGDAAIVQVVPRAAPQDEATTELVHRLRDDVLPSALAGSGVRAEVGGVTATLVDQSDLISGRLPLFVAGVIGVSFLLLLAAFRSPLIALKAGVMNLLSVGAAYGAVALVADGGRAGSLVGIDAPTPVPPFIPVMMFAILFGLSMDYEVFLLSRVREEYLRRRDNGEAVTAGLAATARVITAAAAIMVAVFLAFVVSGDVFLILVGVGMATAIFVDATVIRMVLVPAVMQLMGRANWWIPAWLDRALPRLDAEPSRR
ncbi:MAG: MMPL family transporter [Thermoleophilia bacterium]